MTRRIEMARTIQLLSVMLVLSNCGWETDQSDSTVAESDTGSLVPIAESPVPRPDTTPAMPVAQHLDRVDSLIGIAYLPEQDSLRFGGRDFHEGDTYYAIWLREDKDGLTILLTTLISGYGGQRWPSSAEWEVVDARHLPRLDDDEELAFAGACTKEESHRRDIVAVIPRRSQGFIPMTPLRAWIGNVESGAIEPFATEGLLCEARREGN